MGFHMEVGMKWQLAWVSMWKWYELASARCSSVLLKFANFLKFSLSSSSFLIFSNMVFWMYRKVGHTEATFVEFYIDDTSNFHVNLKLKSTARSNTPYPINHE
jgi:hypothetical protein